MNSILLKAKIAKQTNFNQFGSNLQLVMCQHIQEIVLMRILIILAFKVIYLEK